MKYSAREMSPVMQSGGFHSDLISSDDSFMRCDCPSRLASAQIPCSSHGREMAEEQSDMLQGLLCTVSTSEENGSV